MACISLQTPVVVLDEGRVCQPVKDALDADLAVANCQHASREREIKRQALELSDQTSGRWEGQVGRSLEHV